MNNRLFGMVSIKSSIDYTLEAIKSFFKCTKLSPNDRVVLVDNDGSLNLELYKQWQPKLELFVNPKPLCFAHNGNQFLNWASENKSDLFFLNNDIIFTKDWDIPMSVGCERGLLSPLSNMQLPYAVPGFKLEAFMDLHEYTGHETEFEAIAIHHKNTKTGYLKVPFFYFYCVKIPYDVYADVGIFDENFNRGGGEDIDYAIRCHQKGWQSHYAQNSFILHFQGKSTWRGTETEAQVKERTKKIYEYFISKWGADIYNLVAFQDYKVLNKIDPSLKAQFENGRYAPAFTALARLSGFPDKSHKATIMTGFDGKPMPFYVYPQEWVGNRIDFYFEDHRHQNSGWMEFQADNGGLVFKPGKPYTQFATPEALNNYLMEVVRIFVRHYHFGHSPPHKDLPKYDQAYHERSGYLKPNELEVSVKKFQAGIIVDLASPKKAIVAGSSSGELIRQLCTLGVDAHGFDIIPDLQNHVSEDIKTRVKFGSVQNVPFDACDGFDTYIALDVMEHIPECDIEKTIAEWLRLGVKKVVLLINHNEFVFEGHITLRPPSWWAQRFSKHFKLVKTFQLDHQTLYTNDNDSNHIWELWERI